jgi:hypothetical protein
MSSLMRPLLASLAALLLLPATAAAQTTLDYAAPTASISRGAPLTFAVRTDAPEGSVVIRVSGTDTTDANGLLSGETGSYLDETASQATDDLQVWAVPAGSVLRQRPGHYYWQAYLTGDAAALSEAPVGPVQELKVTLPAKDRGKGKLFPRFGRKGVRAFFLSSADFPATVSGARFKAIARAAANRWGLKARTWTSATAGVEDGFSVAGFSTDVPAGTLGVQTDYVEGGKVVESDLALRAEENWAAGPDYPALDQVDLQSVVLHELGHMAGNKKHTARCSNSPMMESLGAGEWWRGARDQWFGSCGATAAVARRGLLAHRVVLMD